MTGRLKAAVAVAQQDTGSAAIGVDHDDVYMAVTVNITHRERLRI